ncbi:MAG TPA: CBS domain-containing protein [Polyangia bacterium]|nr:CBS domain-containing protein [Polyangia bacterium]
MLCKEIMKRNVECVEATDTVETAAETMRDQQVGFLPVCDQSTKVIGTITDRDITVRVVAESLSASTLVEKVMTSEVVACRADDDVHRAEDLMGQYQKSRIMCLDEQGRLVGVISLSDIAQVEDDPAAAETMRQVTDRETHPRM